MYSEVYVSRRKSRGLDWSSWLPGVKVGRFREWMWRNWLVLVALMAILVAIVL